MASSVLTNPSTGVKGTTWKKGWRLAGQHRAGIHCSIAIDGVRDAHQEAEAMRRIHHTSTDDIALRRRRDAAGDLARTGHLAQHGACEYLARIAAAGSPSRCRPELTDEAGNSDCSLMAVYGSEHAIRGAGLGAVTRELKRPGVALMIL